MSRYIHLAGRSRRTSLIISDDGHGSYLLTAHDGQSNLGCSISVTLSDMQRIVSGFPEFAPKPKRVAKMTPRRRATR